MKIKYFDSLIHATLTEEYINKKESNTSFINIKRMLSENDHLLHGACIVGLPGVGGYEAERFFKSCKELNNVVPVAAVNFSSIEELQALKDIGYCAVKIHPRLIGDSFSASELHNYLVTAGRLGLVVFLCTYPSYEEGRIVSLSALAPLLSSVPGTKVVLLHGGCGELFRYHELVRSHPNLLLDLSFTLQKYCGSSVETDIRFLFEKFDQRVCIGSDYPDFTVSETYKIVEELTCDLNTEKKENLYFRNLINFLGVV